MMNSAKSCTRQAAKPLQVVTFLASLKECCALQFDQLRCCFALALVFTSQSFRFLIWKPLDLDASAGSEDLRCSKKVGVLDAGNKVEKVAAQPASETVINLLRRMHREGWSLFLVERTQAEEIHATLAERDVLRSHFHEIIPLANLFHGFDWNHRHRLCVYPENKHSRQDSRTF